MYMPELYWCWG